MMSLAVSDSNLCLCGLQGCFRCCRYILGQELQSHKTVQLYILGLVDHTHTATPSFSTMR